MRIGISVRGRRSQDFWRDGASQHAVFLAGAFSRLPFVRAVVLIDVGNECRLPHAVDAIAPGLRVVSQQQATDEIDVVIELADGLDDAWLALMRSRGATVIGHRSESPYVEFAAPPASSRAARPDWYDEIWLLPKDRLTLPLMHTLYGCPVRVVPFVWLPTFVEPRIAALERSGVHYGYDAARAARDESGGGWRVAIIEPDLHASNEPGVPMFACEDAYRADPAALSEVHVLNAQRVNERATRALLADSFDLVRDHRATFHGPHDFVDFVGKHVDAVFGYQRNDGEACCYLDVLYGGYPLIHNAPWLLDAGYYYPGADTQQGARALLAAMREHDAAPDAYRARSRALFDAIDPFSDANLRAYAQALSSLRVE
jgi:hypothetical protein